MGKLGAWVDKITHAGRFWESSRDGVKKAWSGFSAILVALFTAFKKEKVFWLAGAIAILVIGGALGFALQEVETSSFADRLGHGLWWAVVTLTTVGYGDLVPHSLGGRLVGVGLMLSGLVILSLLTATVASVFIERKFRRERGLENITTTDHIILMGWHEGGERILRDLLYRIGRRLPVVLINDLTPEQFEAIKDKFSGYELYYVRGDFCRAEILHKANLRQARKVVILADRLQDLPREQRDQRTLLAALAVKSLNPKIKVCAELLNPDNRPHLERARVEDIIVRGEYDSALIASATISAGLFKVLQTLLGTDGPNFWVVKVPPRFQGTALKEFDAYLRNRYQALIIALFTEGQALRLEDLLADEPSAIDDFIRRKFIEADLTHLFGRHRTDYLINPPADHIIGPNEVAVVIATEEPSALRKAGLFEQL